MQVNYLNNKSISLFENAMYLQSHYISEILIFIKINNYHQYPFALTYVPHDLHGIIVTSTCNLRLLYPFIFVK